MHEFLFATRWLNYVPLKSFGVQRDGNYLAQGDNAWRPLLCLLRDLHRMFLVKVVGGKMINVVFVVYVIAASILLSLQGVHECRRYG